MSPTKASFSKLERLELKEIFCVLQLSLCRSHCNGCIQVAGRHGCIRNTLVFCLLSFVAGLRESYSNGCIKAAIVICQEIFSI